MAERDVGLRERERERQTDRETERDISGPFFITDKGNGPFGKTVRKNHLFGVYILQ